MPGVEAYDTMSYRGLTAAERAALFSLESGTTFSGWGAAPSLIEKELINCECCCCKL